jgi:hypothetical protein
MNPISAFFLLGVPFGIFYGVDRLGHKAPVLNVPQSEDSGKSLRVLSSSRRRDRAAQLCAA